MHLIQLLLPLYNNSGGPIDKQIFLEVRKEIVERFGGLTAYTRAPADGVWQGSDKVVRDDLVIYEVITDFLDENWWRDYRILLETRFQQASLLMRTHEIRIL